MKHILVRNHSTSNRKTKKKKSSIFTITGAHDSRNRGHRSLGLSNNMNDQAHQQDENLYSDFRHSSHSQERGVSTSSLRSSDVECFNTPSFHLKEEDVYENCKSDSNTDYIEMKRK
jgi:hypothetical protein